MTLMTELLPADLESVLFQSNPDPMWVYDTVTLQFLAVNDTAIARYGYSRAEFLTMSLVDIRPPEDVEALHTSLALMSDKRQTSSIWHHRTKAGDMFWADAFSHAVMFLGRTARLVTVRDVTAQKRAEEASITERSLTDAILDTAGALILVMDCEGRITRFNRACELLTGYQADEVIGKYFWNLLLRPDDIAVAQSALTHMNEGHFPVNAERVWVTRDGQERLLSWTNTALTNERGEAQFIVITGLDVTEQRQAEEALRRTQNQYRSLFENAIEGIFQTTPEGRYLSANPALAHIYGYESPEELISRLDDIAQGLYVDPHRRSEFIFLMYTDGIVVNFESQVRRKDGQIIWISESSRAVRDSDGEVAYYEGMVEEITERKALEAEREALLAEAIARADRDPLTGLLNHRAFHKRLEEEANHALRMGHTLSLVLLDMDNFGFFNEAYGHAVGDDVLRRVAAILQDCCGPADVPARFGGDEFALLLCDTGAGAAARLSQCLAQLAEAGYRPPGYDCIIPLRLSLGLAVFPDDGQTRQDVLHTADTRLLRAKTGGDGDAPAAHLRETLTQTVQGFSMLDALVTAVDNKDRYTRKHSEDVMGYSLEIAYELGLSENDRQRLQTAALLHDVGKIGVPDHILRKPGRLTDEEFEAIKHHPLMGAVIVGAVAGMEGTLDAVRHHHERWDGEGYPFGLRGEETPLAARIMAVADAYSAMTTNRPYRQGMPPPRALALLEQGAGTQWDPHCVHAFLRARRLHHRHEGRLREAA